MGASTTDLTLIRARRGSRKHGKMPSAIALTRATCRGRTVLKTQEVRDDRRPVRRPLWNALGVARRWPSWPPPPDRRRSVTPA
jgi:hypothetical protein